MSKTQQITDAIVAQGILPLYFNPSEEVSLDVLKAIYTALGAEQNVHFIVSEGKRHEMDVNALLGFLAR